MLTENFFDAAREYTTKADLTEAETAAMNKLGKSLGFNNSFAATFSSMIQRGFWQLAQTWGHDDKDGKRVNTHESLMGCSLYTPVGNNSFERIPAVHFSYWENKPDGSKDMILNVDFLPAYLISLEDNSSAMAPLIRSLSDNPDNIIHCTQSQNIMRALRGEEPLRQGTVLGSVLKILPKAPEA